MDQKKRIVRKRPGESEKLLESKLRDAVRRMGGVALKHSSQFHRGIPDRIVVLPEGRVAFVELKTTGKKPTGLQEHEIARLRNMGHRVYVVDSTESLEGALQEMETGRAGQ